MALLNTCNTHNPSTSQPTSILQRGVNEHPSPCGTAQVALNCDWSERRNNYDNVELSCRLPKIYLKRIVSNSIFCLSIIFQSENCIPNEVYILIFFCCSSTSIRNRSVHVNAAGSLVGRIDMAGRRITLFLDHSPGLRAKYPIG